MYLGFADDVMFYIMALWRIIFPNSDTSITTEISTEVCSAIKTGKQTSSVVHGGKVCYLQCIVCNM